MSDSESTPHSLTENLDKCISGAKERDGGGVVATFKIATPSNKIDVASLNENHQYVIGVMSAAFPCTQLQFTGAGHIQKEDVLHFAINEGPAAAHVRQVMARRAQSGEAEIS